MLNNDGMGHVVEESSILLRDNGH